MSSQSHIGAIRLRSNIVLSDLTAGGSDPARVAMGVAINPWTLVPGEIVAKYNPNFAVKQALTARQVRERGLYIECSVCGRRQPEIFLEGCDPSRCVAPPPISQVEATRARRARALEMIAAERARIDEALTSTEQRDVDPIGSAEAAVDRFLALRVG